MDLGLKDKSVLVLASSKGLGKATAAQFAAEGARVYLASRNEEALQQTAEEIKRETDNPHVAFSVCDMTDYNSIKQLVADAARINGGIDVLVNNTGGPPAGLFDDVDDQDWQRAFELNLLSFTRAIREVLPHIRKRGGGHIVNFASSSIKQPIDNLILSNTFRAGITGLSKSLSQELAGDNILINTIGPGRISTDRVQSLDSIKADALDMEVEDLKAANEKEIPIGRYGEPDEFAKLAVFLCSEANTYITGQSLLVDGGMVKAL
ncbi:SDR family oxidoreductase [Lentibacillus cibarius]|uniref:SDR family oxidoreductase n=1 Tax=Lentibacillus cibarius TaxID=2583219 RepID=A0A549YEY6_9BACI|nr:SDR family oxidoreductase [Lentibacillus cibarius]TMN21508.1 SDR family oxidoreductase [Lentibacillus cibarius]TRM10407.1 SDR family oxidoreductase [Lentibacillus cibarius]